MREPVNRVGSQTRPEELDTVPGASAVLRPLCTRAGKGSTGADSGSTEPLHSPLGLRLVEPAASAITALCAESEVRKAVQRSSHAVALKFCVFSHFKVLSFEDQRTAF